MKGHSLPYYIGGICLMAALFFGPSGGYAQGVSIGDTDALPHPSAMLDVQSVNKGLLIPRMNYSQRAAIAAPANGLMVYQVANQAVGGVLYRRGFWYWDEIQNKWIHLGDERTGVVDQAAESIESTLGDLHFAVPEEGQNTIFWLTPFSTPPTVLVVPEFSAVATPPDITDYCQPDNTGCGANRANQVALYHPNWVTGTPTMLSWLAHASCTGIDNTGTSNATSYKYLPYPTGSGWTSMNASQNWGTIDLCAEPTETMGVWVRVYNNLTRSFRFFIDKNQDGDFDDPGEQIGEFINQAPTGNNEFIWGGGGTTLPALPIPPDLVNGVTKFRVIMRRNTSLSNNPCYSGDPDTFIYDFDVNVECGGGGLPFYANDLNWCNVDDVTASTARVSCFDQNGAAADTKYHYKVISHD